MGSTVGVGVGSAEGSGVVVGAGVTEGIADRVGEGVGGHRRFPQGIQDSVLPNEIVPGKQAVHSVPS